jgi:hypothetical protein
MKHNEYNLQKQVCQYLNYQYPNVFFLSDTIANLKLSIPQQVRNNAIQKKNFHCPDLLILEPNNTYNGLFIELKTATPYKLNGEIKASSKDHLLNQQKTILKLNEKGYKSFFAWDFETIIKEIDNYLKLSNEISSPNCK